MTTLFACSLDNGVVCQSIRKLITSALLIQVMPKSRLICFSMLLPLQKTGFLISVQSDGLVPVQYKLWTEMGYDILFLPGLSKIFMCWSSKLHNIGYPHWNKHCPLISTAALNVAPFCVVLYCVHFLYRRLQF